MSRIKPLDDYGNFYVSQKSRNKINKRESIIEKFNRRCAYCGCELAYKKMQVDHVIPLSLFDTHVSDLDCCPEFLRHLKEGMANHFDNLFPTCGGCNNEKHDFTLGRFRDYVYKAITETEYPDHKLLKSRYKEMIKEDRLVFYFEKFID